MQSFLPYLSSASEANSLFLYFVGVSFKCHRVSYALLCSSAAFAKDSLF